MRTRPPSQRKSAGTHDSAIQEAVCFFQQHADCLFPSMTIPPEVEKMSVEDANAYLIQHPIQRQWCLLTIGPDDQIQDTDLTRLQYLPEIGQLKIFSDGITDAGVKHLLHLRGLSNLVLYSKQVTDECLKDIQTIRSLVSLDIQAASGVSRAAVLDTLNKMPWLQDAWPPTDPIQLAECQRRSRLSQIGRSDRDPAGQAASRESETSLRYVDLSRKPLAHPPAELFSNNDIWRLDLIDCGVEVLPDVIGNLTRLRTLYANWGRLAKLPTTLGLLTALEFLWLNDNRLTELPESFGSLTRLKELSLDSNQFDQFPKVLLKLKRLETLRMTDNRLSTLPEEIGELTELRSLSLGRNDLRMVTRSIGRLEKLTYLGLQDNQLRSLPDELWRLPCLVTLNLANTGLTKLPPEAANIPNIIGLPGQRVHS